MSEEITQVAEPRQKKSEIARIITDKLLISNETYSCTLVKNRIISSEEQRHELESITIKKGEKSIINLKNKDDVRNFIDLCWNISMQLTREIAGVSTERAPPITPPSSPPVNHFVAMDGGIAVPDDTLPPPKQMRDDKPTNEVQEAFAMMERARAARMGGAVHGGNPYAKLQARIDSHETFSQSIGADGLTEDQLSPEQRAAALQIYGDIENRMKVEDRAMRTSVDPIDGRMGKSKLRILRDQKNKKIR